MLFFFFNFCFVLFVRGRKDGLRGSSILRQFAGFETVKGGRSEFEIRESGASRGVPGGAGERRRHCEGDRQFRGSTEDRESRFVPVGCRLRSRRASATVSRNNWLLVPAPGRLAESTGTLPGPGRELAHLTFRCYKVRRRRLEF